MAEIPHKWFYKGNEVEMVGPMLDSQNKIIGLIIKQDGRRRYFEMDSDGNFDPDLGYELIN